MAKDNNTTGRGQASGMEAIFNHIQTVSLVTYCVIIIFGALGNGLVIYVTCFRMKRTVNSVWFLNLALADFLFIALLIFLVVSTSQKYQWPFGLFMCKSVSFVAGINMYCSVFILMAISVDRCLSIWVVVWAHNKRTVRKAQLLSFVIWMTAGVCSSPMAIFRTLRHRNGSTRCVYPAEMTIDQKWSIYVFRFVIGFLIPFLVILVSYVAIGIRAGRLQGKKKKKSVRIITSVILAFFFCWLPFHIFSFLELKANGVPGLLGIIIVGGTLSNCLAFLNSCLNPILYVFMCEEFKKKIRQSICSVFESTLAEDQLSPCSTTPHSLQATQRLDSDPSVERGATVYINLTESRLVIAEETANSR